MARVISSVQPAHEGGMTAGVLVKRTALTLYFVFCMHPVSIGVGVGVNYAFLLLPLLVALAQGRLRYPGDTLTMFALFFVLVFFIATLYQVDQFAMISWRFGSFLVFMSLFSYAFITIDPDKIAAFKASVVVISVYLSLESAFVLLEASTGKIVGFEAKDLVGTQRIGFIYLIALWLAYLDPPIKRLLGLFRYPVLLVLLAGLVLTFSRSSIVSLFVGFFLFALVKHGNLLRRLSARALLNGVATIVGIIAFGLILFWLFPVAFQFFDVRLLSFLTNEGDVVTALNSRESSEGARVYIAMNVIEFVIRNPFTGSGYLGVWTIPGLPAGSAHGQYMDVLFRTGPIGFLCYLSIFYAVLRYLRRGQEALFWGVL
jgi:O-antigen ligase